ncbi:MAG: NAD(P)-dependent alcohol dehydrogenase [Acidobacteria bacterium]|nr:NAD(P)-dependent alcohol dehydrogenase [Acidobacteriota bacterium]
MDPACGLNKEGETVKIQAYAASGPGAPLEPFEYQPAPPNLEPTQVEISISHCGMCHTDIHLWNNDWGFTQYPMVPGHEIAGTVTEAGSLAKSFREGQRVGLGWESGSCGECQYCRRGEENVCLAWKGTCTHGYGGYASAIRADSRFVIPIPEGLDSEAAAPLLCGGITVYAPLAQEVHPAMRVGVVGVGGLGHLAVQYARAFGCEVAAFSTSPDKEAEARRLGANRFINAREEGALEQAANSCDFVISTVSADLDWAAYLNVLKPKGKLCVVGVPASELRLPAFPLIVGRKSVFGSPVGSPSLIREMLEFSARNGVLPVTERFPMARVNEALARLKANQARYRIVLAN